jgi:hypothetical protein
VLRDRLLVCVCLCVRARCVRTLLIIAACHVEMLTEISWKERYLRANQYYSDLQVTFSSDLPSPLLLQPAFGRSESVSNPRGLE